MDFNLKNLILAGIGSVAYTYEKASDIIDEMVKKGELTVNQGKELNEELKIKMHCKKNSDDIVTTDKLKNILAELNLVTKEDLVSLNERISKLEDKSE